MRIHHGRGDPTQCPNGGIWYKCAATHDHDGYAGCCLVNACVKGCPEDQDRTPPNNVSSGPGALPTSSLPSSATPLSSHEETSTPISASNSALSTATANSIPTSRPSTETLSPDHHISSGTHVGAIVGGTVGSVVLLTAILSILFLLCRRKRIKQERRATLPPSQNGVGDMSEQLMGVTTIISAGTGTVRAHTGNSSTGSIPQLDGTAIVPPSEAVSDALGNIPELEAIEKSLSPFSTPNCSDKQEITQGAYAETGRPCGSVDHVMSWANLNSMGNRIAESRLSRPRMAPDGQVWENMSPSKRKGGF